MPGTKLCTYYRVAKCTTVVFTELAADPEWNRRSRDSMVAMWPIADKGKPLVQ
jgi:hypothetical protein